MIENGDQFYWQLVERHAYYNSSHLLGNLSQWIISAQKHLYKLFMTIRSCVDITEISAAQCEVQYRWLYQERRSGEERSTASHGQQTAMYSRPPAAHARGGQIQSIW